MSDIAEQLSEILPPGRLLLGEDIAEDYGHDECLTVEAAHPSVVVMPETTQEVAAVLRYADANGIAITARGSGTGLSGSANPHHGAIVISFEKMKGILEIDQVNNMATVQPGIQLDELDAALEPLGLAYQVYPGEYSASLGGNISTNAGGMRAVRYGVTRHNVLGLEAVLPGGEVIRTGGKCVKSSTGYDLTQLIIGSEGTLAVVTEATLKLHPRIEHQVTVLAPFNELRQVTDSIPRIIESGLDPLILEYIDLLTMSATQSFCSLELGIPQEVKDSALAYLVVMLENPHADRLDADAERLSEMLAELGAIDVYVLPSNSAAQLIDAREKAFWMAKANGADDVVDIVVPRGSIPEFMDTVSALGAEYEAWIAGCGHAGDGNVHLGVFCADPDKRSKLLTELFRKGMELGGAISGEHGVGRAKKPYFDALEDPNKIALMRRIKVAFDPKGILNPGVILDPFD